MRPESIERIMLAVTGVNDCAVCSHGHARMALEAGMSSEEIRDLLAGVMDDVPAGDVPAVLFAQHYADSRGNPSKESWERIVELYGLSRARGILGAVRMIMVGNTYGIPMGSFINRFRRSPDPRSSLPYRGEHDDHLCSLSPGCARPRPGLRPVRGAGYPVRDEPARSNGGVDRVRPPQHPGHLSPRPPRHRLLPMGRLARRHVPRRRRGRCGPRIGAGRPRDARRRRRVTAVLAKPARSVGPALRDGAGRSRCPPFDSGRTPLRVESRVAVN